MASVFAAIWPPWRKDQQKCKTVKPDPSGTTLCRQWVIWGNQMLLLCKTLSGILYIAADHILLIQMGAIILCYTGEDSWGFPEWHSWWGTMSGLESSSVWPQSQTICSLSQDSLISPGAFIKNAGSSTSLPKILLSNSEVTCLLISFQSLLFLSPLVGWISLQHPYHHSHPSLPRQEEIPT